MIKVMMMITTITIIMMVVSSVGTCSQYSWRHRRGLFGHCTHVDLDLIMVKWIVDFCLVGIYW